MSDHTLSDRDLSNHGSEPNETIEDVVNEALCSDVPRRDFLRRVVRLGVSSAVAYKLLDETTAQAQTGGNPRITTFALGEEGNPPAQSPSPNPPRSNPTQRPTTLTVGEESNRVPTTLSYGLGEEGSRPTTMAVGEESRPTPTTLAVGEEGNPVTTTKAVGEEQPYCPTPQPTTKAVGEEGRPIKPNPTTLRNGEESTITTRALGEENTGRPTPTPTTLAVGEEGNPTPQPVPKITTRAVGEEGSSGGPQFKVPSQLYKNIPTPWKNFRRW